jgi:hypothetical protein
MTCVLQHAVVCWVIAGAQLGNPLHQWLSGRHLFIHQSMPPRQPGSKIAGSVKFFEPKGAAGSRLVLGVKPPRPLAWVVFGHPQVEVVDFWPHGAVEAAYLVLQWALDDEDSSPQRPVGFDPQETFA